MNKKFTKILLRMGSFLLVMAAIGLLVHLLPASNVLTNQQIRQIHLITFFACLVIVVAVVLALFYALYRFRRTQGDAAQHFHRRLSIEVLWTAIPLLILALLLIPICLALWDAYGTVLIK